MQGLLKMRELYPLIVAGLDEFVKGQPEVRALLQGHVAGLVEVAVKGVHGEVGLQGGEGVPLLEEGFEQDGDELVGAVARHHQLGADAVAGGEGGAELPGGGVGVAVEVDGGEEGLGLLQDGRGQGQEALVGVQPHPVAALDGVVGL